MTGINSSFTTDKIICGVDEAGRGPLAGPVYAACVVLDPAYEIIGLADSKRLSEKKRNGLAAQIKQHARAWAVAFASVAEIDQLNILQATLLAMQRAVIAVVQQLSISDVLVLIDGNQAPKLDYEVRTVIKGDSAIAEISAASILAKTARDTEMLQLHEIYPAYGFDRHKGYPTRAHLEAIHLHGITDIHRRSFAPCAEQLVADF